ncbi:hypothetical protein GC177_03455 [bacterium]|nr:hypothetical protein [bacterium]
MTKLSYPSRFMLCTSLSIGLELSTFLMHTYLFAIHGVILALLTLALYFSSLHQREIRQITRIANQCATGNLEQRIILPASQGEMRSLVYAVNRFIDVADAYIRESGASAEHAARGLFYRNIMTTGLSGTWKQASEGLNSSSHKVRQNLIATAKDAGARLEQSVMQTIAMLNNSITQLMNTSNSLSEVARQNDVQAVSLSHSSTITLEKMGNIATAMDAMATAVREISYQVNHANDLSREVVAEGERTRAVIQNLMNSSSRIGEITKFITGIASQVTLLALNATIEAQHAGEAGKGFAVVASEVKDLATRTTQATSEVEQYTNQIQEQIAQTSETISHILDRLGGLSQVSCVIASAVEEQTATSQEISSNLQATTDAARQFSASVEAVTKSAAQSKEAAQLVSTSSTTLSGASNALNSNITRFIESLGAAA